MIQTCAMASRSLLDVLPNAWATVLKCYVYDMTVWCCPWEIVYNLCCNLSSNPAKRNHLVTAALDSSHVLLMSSIQVASDWHHHSACLENEIMTAAILSLSEVHPFACAVHSKCWIHVFGSFASSPVFPMNIHAQCSIHLNQKKNLFKER